MADASVDLNRLVDAYEQLKRAGSMPGSAPYEPSLMTVLRAIQEEDRQFVQVRFESGGRTYAYHCSGAEIGDYVVTPPNWYNNRPQLVRVIALGRSSYRGECRPAHLVPRAIATGEDYGRAG